MDRLTPEFAAHWLAEPERSGEPDGIDHGPKQSLSPSQQVALEELADRVNAARSVLMTIPLNRIPLARYFLQRAFFSSRFRLRRNPVTRTAQCRLKY